MELYKKAIPAVSKIRDGFNLLKYWAISYEPIIDFRNS
jgi:hypothetical protein